MTQEGSIFTKVLQVSGGSTTSTELFRLEVPGHIQDRNAVVSLHQNPRFQQSCALGMEEVIVPALLDQFGDDHNDTPAGIVSGQPQNVIHYRCYDEPIG